MKRFYNKHSASCIGDPPLENPAAPPVVRLSPEPTAGWQQPATLPPSQDLSPFHPLPLPMPPTPLSLSQPLTSVSAAKIQQQSVPVVAKVGELTLPKDETQFLISLCLCVVLFLTLNPLGLTCLIPAWIMESKASKEHKKRNFGKSLEHLKVSKRLNICGCVFAAVYEVLLLLAVFIGSIVAFVILVNP